MHAANLCCRRKQQEVAAQLQELGEEALEERLRSATSSPARPPHRLTELIATIVPQASAAAARPHVPVRAAACAAAEHKGTGCLPTLPLRPAASKPSSYSAPQWCSAQPTHPHLLHMLQGRPVLVLELARSPEAPSSESLGQLAAALVAAGADALAVKTDAADTPEPLKDLLAVSRSAGEAAKRRQPRGGAMAAAAAGGLGGGPTAAELGVPVLQRDWYLVRVAGAGAGLAW